jgi:hypothetical protein
MTANEPPSSDAVRDLLAEEGFAIVSGVLDKAECQKLIKLFDAVNGPGRRGILGLPQIARLASSRSLLDLVQPHLPGKPRPVRGIYFDKSLETNWLVAWHQDVTLAVRNQFDVPGFGPWSVKEGVPHVRPPVHLLEQMLTVRLHLDDCDEANGALRVIPGSHRSGQLSADAIERLRNEKTPTVCRAAAGDGLLMRPLVLHSSGRSKNANHRRVVHIEYASFLLPGGLEWHETP